MADITAIDIYHPVTIRDILKTVSRWAVQEPPPRPEQVKNPLLVAMAKVAALRLPNAPKSVGFSELELQSTLCKETVKWCLRMAEETEPPEMVKAIQKKVLDYTLLVSIPHTCSKLPDSLPYANWLIYQHNMTISGNTSFGPNTPEEIRNFYEDWRKNPKTREKLDSFTKTVIAHRDAWIQGVLGEVLVLRLAQKAGLQPECASVQQDIGPQHIDCFITYNGRRIPVQVKTSQSPQAPRITLDPKSSRLLVTVGCPSIIDPNYAQYYKEALYPSEEEAQRFKNLLKTALNYQIPS